MFTAPRYHSNQHFSVKALVDAGHEVSFFVLRVGHSEVHEALVPIVLGKSKAFELIRSVFAKAVRTCLRQNGGMPPVGTLWREFRKIRPEITVVRGPRSSFGLLAAVVVKLIGAKLIFYSQGPKRRKLMAAKKFGYSFALWAIGARWITPVLGSPEKNGGDINRIHYVPFVITPLTCPQEKQWFSGGVINILTIGKFQPRKNHRLFLEAVGRLSRSYPIRATIIGECTTQEHRGELEDVKRHCQHLGLDARVEFKINLPFPDVQKQYPKHDMFVLASRDEPAAVSPLEAMAHSLPVVCSDSNGTSCYVRSGESGFVFHTDDLDDLEACMSRLVSDRQRLIKMGHRSYQLVVSEHAPKRYVETLLAIAGS